MPKSKTITIDIDAIAKEMKNRGITSVESGWTNTLMDILEEQYSIETAVRKAIGIK